LSGGAIETVIAVMRTSKFNRRLRTRLTRPSGCRDVRCCRWRLRCAAILWQDAVLQTCRV